MYKALSPSVLKELENQGIVMYISEGKPKAWVATRYRVYFIIGSDREHIFNCLIQEYDNTVHVSDVETSDFLKKEEQGLVEAYLYLAIKGAIRYVRLATRNKEEVKLIFDSYLTPTPECLSELGFKIFPSAGPYRGYVKLKELECQSVR